MMIRELCKNSGNRGLPGHVEVEVKSKEVEMRNIIYIVGLVVIVLAIVSFVF